MPLTALDPNTPLIVIDLQKGIVDRPFIHPIREEAHDYSIRNVFPRISETGSTQEITALLEIFEARSSTA
jgi:hypothetical protein